VGLLGHGPRLNPHDVPGELGNDGRVTLPGDVPDPRAVLGAFAIGGELTTMTPVSGAWSNRVWRLAGSDGAFAVKELRNPWQDPGWQHWLAEAWEFELRALHAGISMPEPIPNPADGHCLAWVPTVSGDATVPVRVHRWIPGAAPGPGAVGEDLAAWAGRTLAMVHGLGVLPQRRDLFPATNTDTAEQWEELAAAARQHDAPWSELVETALPAVRLAAGLATSAAGQPAAEVMSHGDIDQKNLVLTPEGPVLCDWDLALPVVPRRELADVAVSFAAWKDPVIARAVVGAYRRAGGEAAGFRPDDLGPSLMHGLDWIAFNIQRAIGLRAGTPAERQLSDGLAAQLLERLPAEVDLALRLVEFLDGVTAAG
jgi:aminoglycoside phosphotransferase (APT) family kinase protein